MTKAEANNKKTKIECLLSCGYINLTEADGLICELVDAGELPKSDRNKIYNIILQLRGLDDERR